MTHFSIRIVLLQGSVPEHDSVEGQGSADGLLLHELHEGEACRLSLVSGHSHKLDLAHLLEELQQLVCSGGLQRGGGIHTRLNDKCAATECGTLILLGGSQSEAAGSGCNLS